MIGKHRQQPDRPNSAVPYTSRQHSNSAGTRGAVLAGSWLRKKWKGAGLDGAGT